MLLTKVESWRKCFNTGLLKGPKQHFFFFSYWKTSELHLVSENFFEKGIVCQKSFENILNCIMQNSTYMQENIISAFIKTLQINYLPLLAAR